jgi:hypothetical protein
VVTQRRVGPLLFALCIALGVVLVRAFQVQVLQHGIWAAEAAGMLQSSEVLPYHRGQILDRNGLVLARDEDRDEVRLVYRDFRRGSPIAQVAHARSSLEMRAVPLPEAEQNLEAWAAELVGLRPIDLAGFARGAALGSGRVPELDAAQARSALRERRANDLRYYAAELLELPPLDRSCFVQNEDLPAAQRTLLELAAERRGLGPAALQRELEQSLRDARTRLARLAQLVERDSRQSAAEGATPLARLLGLLERERREIEDDTADQLFRDAVSTPDACARACWSSASTRPGSRARCAGTTRAATTGSPAGASSGSTRWARCCCRVRWRRPRARRSARAARTA